MGAFDTRGNPTCSGRGFTLLELMVAIAIFAVLGLMSSQMLNNMIRQNGIIDERGERLIGLQRAMTIMQRDVSQMWSRSVRDEYGENLLPPLHVNDIYPIEFTRIGWRNPLGHQRSELQRVAYEHRENTLYRHYWNVLDRAIDTEPLEQVMLENVLSVEFEPLDGNGDAWQPGVSAGSPDPLLQLSALSVRFDLEGYGEITRLWEIPAELNVARAPAAGGSDPVSNALDANGEPTATGNNTTGGGGNDGQRGGGQDGNLRAAPVVPNQRR